MDEAIANLRKISIFGALKEETLRYFLERATRIEVRAGGLLVREGEPGGDIWVLESGSAEVFKERKGPTAVRVRLAELKAGDCIGETSMLACMPRSASVVAVTDSVALHLRGSDLLDLYHHDLEQFAMFIMNLGRESARRLWWANERLLDRMLP